MYRGASTEDTLLYLAYNGRAFALDKATGRVVWRKDLDEAGDVCLHVEADALFVACANVVMALDPVTGALRWKTQLPLTSAMMPLMLVDASGVYVTLGGEVACVARDGALRWSDPMHGTGYGSPTLAVRGRSVRLETRSD